MIRLLQAQHIDMVAVIKGCCSDLRIADTLIQSGIKTLADSNINHLKNLERLPTHVERMLIRSPALSEVDLVVSHCEISLNSETKVIRALSDAALKQGKIHQVILMIEMGELREGLLESELYSMVTTIQTLKGVKLRGIGTNYSCLSLERPPDTVYSALSNLAKTLKSSTGLNLDIVSGGNSSSLQWALSTRNPDSVNQLRIGDSLLTGRDSISGKALAGLNTDVFSFVGEVIELKTKHNHETQQLQSQALLNFGYQDTSISGLHPVLDIEIGRASSNHTVMYPKETSIKLGSEVSFAMTYQAILQAFTSPTVYKDYTPLRRTHEDRNTMAKIQKHRVSKKDHRDRPQR